MHDNGFDITDTGTPVVFDLGSNSIRVGFCNEKSPSSDIPAVVGSMFGGSESVAHTDCIKEDLTYYMGANKLRIPRGVPHYLIANKRQVEAKKAPIWIMKNKLPKVTNSWHNYMYKSVLEDFQHTVLEVAERQYNDDILSNLPTCHYKFPNGYNREFGHERFKIPEFLFNPSNASNLIFLSKIVHLCTEMLLDRVKDELYENILVTGGNSLIKGFPQRIHREIATNLGNTKRLKLTAPFDSSSRRFGAWNGGSLFATDRKFNHFWFSINDFYECGTGSINGNL